MRYELVSRDGKPLGTLELHSQIQNVAEVWRAMQRLRVDLRPAPVAAVKATALPQTETKSTRKQTRTARDSS